MSGSPSLSIILVCQNPGPRLPATLESIRQQRFVQPEIIVVDRGSTDGAADWLRQQGSALSPQALPAEASLAEALNRGLTASRGDWIFPLDAGDRLLGEVVLSEVLNWMKKTECGVVAGEAATDDGRIYKLASQARPIVSDFVPRSATFYRRGLFDENGPFDPAFPLLPRYEANLRLWKHRIRFKPIPLRTTAREREAPFAWEAAREEISIRHRYYDSWRCWPYDLRSLLRARRKSAPAPRPTESTFGKTA